MVKGRNIDHHLSSLPFIKIEMSEQEQLATVTVLGGSIFIDPQIVYDTMAKYV